MHPPEQSTSLSNSAVISFWQTEKHKQRDTQVLETVLRKHIVFSQTWFSSRFFFFFLFFPASWLIGDLRSSAERRIFRDYQGQMNNDNDDQQCWACNACVAASFSLSFPQMMLKHATQENACLLIWDLKCMYCTLSWCKITKHWVFMSQHEFCMVFSFFFSPLIAVVCIF